MSRFAILRHDHPVLHWDLLLEDGECCLTWRLSAEPTGADSRRIEVEPMPPHRLVYLTYEGPVSGNRGTVTAWDRGTFTWIDREQSQFRLQGERITGVFAIGATLRRIDGE